MDVDQPVTIVGLRDPNPRVGQRIRDVHQAPPEPEVACRRESHHDEVARACVRRAPRRIVPRVPHLTANWRRSASAGFPALAAQPPFVTGRHLLSTAAQHRICVSLTWRPKNGLEHFGRRMQRREARCTARTAYHSLRHVASIDAEARYRTSHATIARSRQRWRIGDTTRILGPEGVRLLTCPRQSPLSPWRSAG